MTSGPDAAPWGKRPDMVVHERDPFNAEPTPAALLAEFLTPVDTFYSRNHAAVPQLDPSTWRLEVDGLVERGLDISLNDLRTRFETHTLTATLQCAGNRRAGLLSVRDIPGEAPWGDGATSTASWTGARLSDVLATASVRSDPTAHVQFLAVDVSAEANPPQRYGSSIPLTKALGDEVLLAWVMNGEPLTAVHGGPMRVIVPGYIGARSVKWVRHITVQREPSDNYFQRTAYRLLPPDAAPGPGAGIALAEVALNCAILDPGAGSFVEAGPVPLRGYAFAGGGRRVVRVDVSGDGGASWMQADLGNDAGPWAWRFWTATLALSPGRHQLVARAWDESAALQPRDPADVWNPKGYVNNSWPRVEVCVRDRG